MISPAADPDSFINDKPDAIKGGLTIVDQGAERDQNRVAPGNEVKVNHDDDNNRVKARDGQDVHHQELESNKVVPKNNQPITSKPFQNRPEKQVR